MSTRNVLLSLIFSFPIIASAQMSLNGQLRTRTEVRDGFGTFLPKDAKPSVFTSQRTRITFGYKWDRITFNASVQDIRVWGQDASTISSAEGNRLMLHEGWADIVLLNSKDSTIKAKFIESLSFKIGRQALNYDDLRLLGELDWAQQARRHDVAVLKALHKGWQVDIGAGFNQNNDAVGFSGTNYIPGNLPQYVTNSNGELVAVPAGMVPLSSNGTISARSSKTGRPVLINQPSTNGMNQEYKSIQFLYLSKSVAKAKVSGLLFKDDFSRYKIDSVGTPASGYVYGRKYDRSGVNSRLTYGASVSGTCNWLMKKSWTVGAYLQSGKDKEGLSVAASSYNANVLFHSGNFTFGPGLEYLSGDKPGLSASKSQRFDPLYPTAHKFWGYMDYFYVATGSPAGGLLNPWFRLKLQKPNFFVSCDLHHFALAENMVNTSLANKPLLGRKLGNELDLVASFNLNKLTTIECGYSVMAATENLEYVKNGTIGQADRTPQWAYLSINIKPDFLYKKDSSAR